MDSKCVEEVVDIILVLMLGLLCYIYVLVRKGYDSVVGWLGVIKFVCIGMYCCKGLVVGIIGVFIIVCVVVVCCYVFWMLVIYFDLEVSSVDFVVIFFFNKI